MMRVTFLAHNGFLVELEKVYLLFDWWFGDLPPLRDKPLIVLTSSRDESHFDPELFELDDGTRDIHFFLGKSVLLDQRHQEKWNLSPETVEKCRHLDGGETVRLPELTLETLYSTSEEEGVAFLVTAEGRTIFHAGGLNWNYWEVWSEAWNEKKKKQFLEYAEPLRGRRIDLAMLPVSPMLREYGFQGPKYFLELADIRQCLSMNQWMEYDYTDEFLEKYPQFAPKALRITEEGQVFELG